MSTCSEKVCGASTGWFRVRLGLFSVPAACPACGSTVHVAPFAQWLGVLLCFVVLVASVFLAQQFPSRGIFVFVLSLLSGISAVQVALMHFAPIQKSPSRSVTWRYELQAVIALLLFVYACWLTYDAFVP